MPKYPYQNDGGPMTWKYGPPPQSRAADATALGNYLVLPAPGAPEVFNGLGDCGCGCKGAGTCGSTSSMSGITDITPVKIAEAGGAYLLYRYSKKKKGALKYGALAAAAYLAYRVVAESGLIGFAP